MLAHLLPFVFVKQKSIQEFLLQTPLYFAVGMEFHFTIHIVVIFDDGDK